MGRLDVLAVRMKHSYHTDDLDELAVIYIPEEHEECL